MIASVLICGITCLALVLSILFFPKIKVGGSLRIPRYAAGKQPATAGAHRGAGRAGRAAAFIHGIGAHRFSLDSYWVVTLGGALAALTARCVDVSSLGRALVADSAINPLKILVLFISMTLLSIFLDEVGFFSYLAARTLKRAKNDQRVLFLTLYLTVSVLTVFTSNDVIILTFTPFICYFAKSAKIDPMPYLFAEFIAANTWSMALIIGNPTNIYLATASHIGFSEYFLTMLLPTAAAGVVSFCVLFLIFRKRLREKIAPAGGGDVQIKDKTLLTLGLVHLGLCTLLLAVSSYVGFEMWYIALGFAVLLMLTSFGVSAARKEKPTVQIACLKRAPWQLIPFVLSMFVLILSLSENGVTAKLTELLSHGDPVFTYGASSFLAANVINNIPMSVLFSSIFAPLTGAAKTQAVYASVVGSNIGAFLTPIGALAGIMWSSILKDRGVRFDFRDFVKYGLLIAPPALLSALLPLAMIL